MNHQPFENWLLDEDSLSSQQQRDLQEHLRGCASCSGVADSNLALLSTRMVMPAPGFTERFRPRLVTWKREQVRRQAMGTVLLVIFGISLLYALAGPAMLEAARSPAAWLGQVTAYAVEVLALFSVIGQVGSILLRNVPSIIPPASWPVTLLACGLLAALWIRTMRRIARAPQGVEK
jgi:hypothetical protein